MHARPGASNNGTDVCAIGDPEGFGTCICMLACPYACMLARSYACMLACPYACMLARPYACMLACPCTCMLAHPYACMLARPYACMLAHPYMHMHAHSPLRMHMHARSPTSIRTAQCNARTQRVECTREACRVKHRDVQTPMCAHAHPRSCMQTDASTHARMYARMHACTHTGGHQCHETNRTRHGLHRVRRTCARACTHTALAHACTHTQLGKSRRRQSVLPTALAEGGCSLTLIP